jgi:hypothetical protein
MKLAKTRLASALRHLFEEAGTAEDLAESINILEGLLRSTPDTDEAPCKDNIQRGYVVSLAKSLLRRFDLYGSPGDIDLAVAKLRGLLTTPKNSPNNEEVWANLSVALLARFDLRGVVTDLDEAEVDMLDTDHPDYTSSHVALANVYLRAFHETVHGPHLDQAIQIYHDALGEKTPWKKLRSGRLAT